jgi:hypothetical protein
MASKRHEGDRACRCDRDDAGCAALTVRRLSHERVRELAEEIWTASGSDELPLRRATSDPRGSHAGASAQAAYQRCRQQEREAWRHGMLWRVGAVAAAALAGGLLVGLTLGAWMGWQLAVLAALLVWWRLRPHPSARARVWRREAAMQRGTAEALEPLRQRGFLVLHDLTLPGWPASLDHLVVGSTGVWVIQSWRRPRFGRLRRASSPWAGGGGPAGQPPRLRWQARRSPGCCPATRRSPSGRCCASTVVAGRPGRRRRWSGTCARRTRGSFPTSSTAGCGRRKTRSSWPSTGYWRCSARRSEAPRRGGKDRPASSQTKTRTALTYISHALKTTATADT